MVSAVIVAGGGSRRMGFDKLSAGLAGKSVLLRSIEAFAQCQDIDEVILVCAPDRDTTGLPVQKTVTGGAERHLSVWNGLEALSPACEIVAVHDGARPLIRPEQISACIAAAREHQAAACARRITDTVKRADTNHRVTESIDREGLWAMETPQVFSVDLLRSAYQIIIANNGLVTDEVSAVQAYGIPVHLIENPWPNPKITFAGDLENAARIL
jgi:2-C-methyl-D-erythritol 4-phosphate cytidylyltransferase